MVFDFFQPSFAPHMIISGNRGVHIRHGAISFGIAFEDSVAQIIDTLRHINRVASFLHGCQHIEHGLKHRKECCRSSRTGVGREIEYNRRDFLVCPLGAP